MIVGDSEAYGLQNAAAPWGIRSLPPLSIKVSAFHNHTVPHQCARVTQQKAAICMQLCLRSLSMTLAMWYLWPLGAGKISCCLITAPL